MRETKLRAAAYIRVSTEEQTEYSPDAQKKALIRYAEENGYLIPESGFYIDEGISGRTAEKRPAFMRMIAQAKSGDHPYDVILVHKFDRFARSREDSVVFKSMLKRECGIRVISITESVEDDKFSLILEAMLEAMAEYYSLNLADEVKKGMTEKHLRGGLQSSPAFGYQVSDHILVPVASEAETVRQIFAMFNEGCGYYQIACRLNRLGIKTRHGNPFESRAVEYIIRNPVYIGMLRWNPSGRTGRDYVNENIIAVNAAHEPIIDKQTWERAQLRAINLKIRYGKNAKPAIMSKDWLTGLIRCAECGNAIVFSGKNKMRCSGYARAKCRFTQSVDAEKLREAVLSRLRLDTAESSPVYHRLLEPAHTNEAAGLKKQYRLTMKKIERLREAYLNGAETEGDYKKAKSVLMAQRDLLAVELDKMNACQTDRQLLLCITRALNDLTSILTSSYIIPEKKYEAAHKAIDRILWDKSENTLKIFYRLLLPPMN